MTWLSLQIIYTVIISNICIYRVPNEQQVVSWLQDVFPVFWGCDGKVFHLCSFLNLANFQPFVHCNPECDQFRPWRCSYVRKSWAKIVPTILSFHVFFHLLLMMHVFFLNKACPKERGGPFNRILWQVASSSDLLPGCVETDQHTHHSCSQRKRGLEGPGGESRGARNAIFAECFLVCIHQKPGPQSGETNNKKAPKTFSPSKTGGTFPCWTVLTSAAKPPTRHR